MGASTPVPPRAIDRDYEVADGPPRLIQFIHPGFEYTTTWLAPRRVKQGIMPWKPGIDAVKGRPVPHSRKFLIARGRALHEVNEPERDAPELGFWGEWEAPSRFIRANDPVPPLHPTVFHRPIQPDAAGLGATRQNTDPLVFGESFVYSNCKQYRKAMQDLPTGSVILFGRGMKIAGEYQFALDTCFVVDDFARTSVTHKSIAPYGEDIVSDLVLGALLSEGFGPQTHLLLYRGRPFHAWAEPFSYFPAVDVAARPHGFARPTIEGTGALSGLITDNLIQGLKPTVLRDSDHARDVWAEVTRQVLDQGCLLGTHAARPPIERIL